jgi:hypothetical protein
VCGPQVRIFLFVVPAVKRRLLVHRNPPGILAIFLLLSVVVVPAAFASGAAPTHRIPAPLSSGAPIAFAPVFAPTPLPRLMASEELAISRSTIGLSPFRLANGTVGLDLQGRFQEFAMVNVAADGKLVFHCVDDADVLRRLLATPLTAAAPVLEDR